MKLSVVVVPRSSQDKIIGPIGASLKVKLKAPPVNGAANKALIALLAKSLQLHKNQIEIVAGLGSRHKQIRLPDKTRMPHDWLICRAAR